MDQFDTLYNVLLERLELKIARGQKRKHMMQVPAVARPKTFKKNYTPKSKGSNTTVNVAKKAQAGVWKLTKHQVVDIAQKYKFNVPTEQRKSKHLGSTGIIMYRQGPGKYFLIKRRKAPRVNFNKGI